MFDLDFLETVLKFFFSLNEVKFCFSFVTKYGQEDKFVSCIIFMFSKALILLQND